MDNNPIRLRRQKLKKPFRTYRQQLKILRERNLICDNGSRAIKILKRENYYNIINGYKEIFLNKSSPVEKFKDNISIEDIYALYQFDRNLRSIILKNILCVETFLKSLVAYYFEQAYQTSFSYLDINNFSAKNIQETTSLISRLSSEIQKNTERVRPNQSPTSPFLHYLSKYQELPMWVLVKKLTLGEIVHFYKNLEPKIQLQILEEFCKNYKSEYSYEYFPCDLDIEKFCEMLSFLNKFRNICAHEDRLYDHSLKHRNHQILQISYFFMKHPLQFKYLVFDVFLIMGFFLTKKDYRTLRNDIAAEVNQLQNELPTQIMNNVLIKMGMRKTWKTDLEYFKEN